MESKREDRSLVVSKAPSGDADRLADAEGAVGKSRFERGAEGEGATDDGDQYTLGST